MPAMNAFHESWPIRIEVNAIELTTERYTVNVTYPAYFLSERSLDTFNGSISDAISNYVRIFVNAADQLALLDGVTPRLDGKHATHTALKRFITAQIDLYPYMGGIHPDRDILTLTFDTAGNTVMALSDLFVIGSKYWERLSILAEKALFEKYPELGFAFHDLTYRKGFAPKAENFRHWALTDSGLIVFFPEYLVAPYAAGTLDIEIPYAAIADIFVYRM